MIYISFSCGYVVRTSSLNDKHSCQLFRMGLRDKTTPISTTPLIRANMSCAVATIFSSLDFLSVSVSTANLSRLVAASFSSLAFFFFCLHGQSEPFTFSSLRLLFNSLSSPRFHRLRVGRHYSHGFLFSYFRVLSSAFLSSVLQSLKLCLL